jgi:hypothetical protein
MRILLGEIIEHAFWSVKVEINKIQNLSKPPKVSVSSGLPQEPTAETGKCF